MDSIKYLRKYLPSERLEEGLKRLEKGEAVQYIVGTVNFYGLLFNVDKRVLIPRFETEELVEKTICYINEYFKDKVDIIDIGTGSGCIAITLNKKINSNVDAVDISEYALEVAKENNLLNKTNVNFIHNNLLEGITKKYDIIISNPPYIKDDEIIMDVVKNNEPHLALYAKEKGLYFYKRILKEAKSNVKDKSLISFEIGSTQANDIITIIKKYFPNSLVKVEKDLNKLDRFVFIFVGF